MQRKIVIRWERALSFDVYLKKKNMTTFALNNLWTYLQGLPLSQSDCEWLADKLTMQTKAVAAEKKEKLTAEDRKARFLNMAGIWSETEEGEEYYQMMKHLS